MRKIIIAEENEWSVRAIRTSRPARGTKLAGPESSESSAFKKRYLLLLHVPPLLGWSGVRERLNGVRSYARNPRDA
jgi:hypothetical protein